jgi:hypothetical protein
MTSSLESIHNAKTAADMYVCKVKAADTPKNFRRIAWILFVFPLIKPIFKAFVSEGATRLVAHHDTSRHSANKANTALLFSHLTIHFHS